MTDNFALRQKIRSGSFTGHTSGAAEGFVQANIAILPAECAFDFLRFCLHNSKPCPVLSVSAPGETALPLLGRDIDIRYDVPKYLVHADGYVREAADIADVWRPDLVTFAIGCSFSFEQALLHAGIALRHIEQGRNVAMYRTNIALNACGRFAGNMVVSMRPMPAAQAVKASVITAAMPQAHGAPVHIGDPAAIGIAALERPDFGEPVAVHAGELPVFWACGVTPFAVLQQSELPFFMTHAPGHMLVTDIQNHDWLI